MGELSAKLQAAKLTDRQLRCLALHYFDGYSQEEIAAQMGITQQAVSLHLAAGLKKLEAHGMRPQLARMEHQPKVVTMATEDLDALGPDEVSAVW